MHLDVATGGELHVALAAGVPADRLVLHGNNKSLERAARGAGRRRRPHRRRQLRRARPPRRSSTPRTGSRPKVLVRATPGVEAHTHDFIRTGQVDSKFGFGVAAGDAARAVARAQDSPAVELVGVHMHIGSQVFVADFFHEAVEVVAPVGARGRACPSCRSAAGSASPTSRARRRRRSPSGAPPSCRAAATPASPPASPAEPGRSIVAQAAVTLYTVGTIKDVPGVRTYVSVDGGMSDNPRPVLYGSGYEAFLPAGHRRRPAEAGDDRRQALRVGRRAGARRPGARRPGRGRRPGHAGHRRLRPLDGLQLQQGAPPGRGVRGRGPTPARSCGGRPTTTSSATTSPVNPLGARSDAHPYDGAR